MTDFWWMVYEQNSLVLVMLTQSVERNVLGKKSDKSAPYFPDEVGENLPNLADSLLITLISEV